MGRLIALTAKSRDGQVYLKPRVIYVNEENILSYGPSKTGRGCKVIEKKALGTSEAIYVVYEKQMQVEAARNPASTDVFVKQQIALALAGAGTTQGAGTAITKYLNEALTIGAAATEAFTLPAATVGKVIVIINNDAAGDAAKVFPAVGEFINAQAVNTVLSIAAGDRVHFVCLVAGKWTTADDFGK